MIPVLPPNTLVLGWLYVGAVRSNDVIIFEHDGKEKIKRVSIVKDDKIYVLGDQPDASTDSRQFGWIDRSTVLAKVIWPNVNSPVEHP